MSNGKMTFNEYRASDGLNWSSLKHMQDSPLAFRHSMDNERDDTSSMLMGRATHTAVLEPDRFRLEYVVYDGKVRRGKEWDAFQAANEGKDILKEDEYGACLAMRDAVRSHAIAADLLAGAQVEKSVFWHRAGHPCKARIDAHNVDLRTLVDLKTTREPGRWFASQAAKLQYHAQLAWYWDALAAEGTPPVQTKIIAVQNSAPYQVVVYDVPGYVLDQGRKVFEPLFERFLSCSKSGNWYGPGEDESGAIEIELQLPAWAVDEDGDDLGLSVGGE